MSDRIWAPLADALAKKALGDRLVFCKKSGGKEYFQIDFAVKQKHEKSLMFRLHVPVGTPKHRALLCRDIALEAAQKGMLEGQEAIRLFTQQLIATVKQKNEEDKQQCQK